MLTLFIGNKAYSSWSLRPWILLATLHIPFEEKLINLYDDAGKKKLRRQSPTAKVPMLVDGDIEVWESIAILEYLAEKYPAKNIWPKNKAARAHARSLCAEMHAGYMALRRNYPTNFRRDVRKRELTPEADAEVAADVARIDAAWSKARMLFGKGGPFLFGKFSAADAMFAPVVNRLYIYDAPVSKTTRDYMTAIMALPAWVAWHADAAKEKWHHEIYDSI
ncbi:glutathione S-transferase family protein [Roseiarcaceae bacterium H3SJ34-1]|uniref:glutathione S-transferase family protein n=1 Tax=Terripilifer ovatus TaxID=3032367 RepID=UPI003AB9ACCE|nr:glutathione S-transferase family protein [Roseiarcaceae bacterium H3SJ34-1]